MSALILVRPDLVSLANALAEGMGWGPENFTGDLAFADPDTRETLWVALHLTSDAYKAFSAALAKKSADPSKELATLLEGMQIEEPATDENGTVIEFGPTHVAGLVARNGWQVTQWEAPIAEILPVSNQKE